jgi:hypothetical protein
MVKAIREAGRVPVQRNTFYEPLKCDSLAVNSATDEGGPPSKLLESNLATA